MQIYESYTPVQIRDELGWSEKTGQDAIDELRQAVMLLCVRVADLEAKDTITVDKECHDYEHPDSVYYQEAK